MIKKTVDITGHVANAKNNHHNHHEYINSSLGHKVLTNELEYRKLQEIRKTIVWDYTYPWFQLVVDSSSNTDMQNHTKVNQPR